MRCPSCDKGLLIGQLFPRPVLIDPNNLDQIEEFLFQLNRRQDDHLQAAGSRDLDLEATIARLDSFRITLLMEQIDSKEPV